MLAEVGLSFVVGVCALEEKAKLAVKASLNVLAIFSEDAGFGGEIEALFVGEDMLLETLYRRDPGGLADEGCDLLDVWLDGGEDLDTRGTRELLVRQNTVRVASVLPVTDQSNMTTREIDVIVPVRRMQQRTLVLLDALDRRPLPVVQDTTCVNKDVAMICDGRARCEVGDLHIVSALLLVPVGASDLVLRLDVLVQRILAGKVVEVGENLARARIHGRPVEFGLKGPSVVVRGDVACASASTRC